MNFGSMNGFKAVHLCPPKLMNQNVPKYHTKNHVMHQSMNEVCQLSSVMNYLSLMPNIPVVFLVLHHSALLDI